MKISLSVAAETRAFAKAMRRILPSFHSLSSLVEAQRLGNPIHEAVLIGLTNSLELGVCEEVPNRDGYFQVLCGLGPWEHGVERDADLRKNIWGAVQRVMEICPFSVPDRAAMVVILNEWERQEIAV